MRDQQFDTLNDDLAIEIEQALAVEPLPDFHARVRQRVAQERPFEQTTFAWWRPACPAAATVVAIAVVVATGWQLEPFSGMGDRRAGVAPPAVHDQPQSDQQPALSVASTARQQATAQETTARPRLRRPQAPVMRTLEWLAPVMVAEDEIAGMRALIADAQAGRFEMAVVTEGVTVASDSPVSGTDVPAAASSESAPTSPAVTAFAPAARPIVIEPVTIEPLVRSVPDQGFEGAAE